MTKLPKSIAIGRKGEQYARTIPLDISDELEQWHDSTPSLIYKRPGEDTVYPGTITVSDNIVNWVIDAFATSIIGSDGSAQLIFTAEADDKTIIGRSLIMRVAVFESLIESEEEPPDAYESWLANLTTLGAQTLENAESAAQSASDAADSADVAQTAAENAEVYADAAAKYGNISVEAYDSATAEAEVVDIPNGKKIVLGLPRGATGTQGAKGDTGDKGDQGTAAGFGTVTATADATSSASPTVTVTPSGPDTAKNFAFAFSGLKGAKGDKGDKGDSGASTAEEVSTDAIAGVDNVEDALSSLSDKIDDLEGKVGPFMFRYEPDDGHLYMDYTADYDADRWSVNSEGHLIYTF